MTGYDLASQIKERLTAQEVVEFYGFHPDRSGFIKCPFHQGDRHASLKVYSGNKTGWHCFGCGAGGSVIDFVMKLFDIDFRQACVRIFHLDLQRFRFLFLRVHRRQAWKAVFSLSDAVALIPQMTSPHAGGVPHRHCRAAKISRSLGRVLLRQRVQGIGSVITCLIWIG